MENVWASSNSSKESQSTVNDLLIKTALTAAIEKIKKRVMVFYLKEEAGSLLENFF